MVFDLISIIMIIESKAQADASRLLLLAFLEYIRGPFSGKV